MAPGSRSDDRSLMKSRSDLHRTIPPQRPRFAHVKGYPTVNLSRSEINQRPKCFSPNRNRRRRRRHDLTAESPPENPAGGVDAQIPMPSSVRVTPCHSQCGGDPHTTSNPSAAPTHGTRRISSPGRTINGAQEFDSELRRAQKKEYT